MHKEIPLFFKNKPCLYTMPSSKSFLDTLAATLFSHYKSMPEALSRVVIILPTRRAARGLAKAFLNAAGDTPAAILLPSILTLGDLDTAQDRLFPFVSIAHAQLPVAVSALTKRLILAQLVDQLDKKLNPTQNNWRRSLQFADELSTLLDSFYTEQIEPEKLEKIIPDRLATHWQQSLEFLQIIYKAWPDILKSQNKTDPADRRRKVIDQLTKSWGGSDTAAKPTHPVIIAGSTASMPAVARLMRVVADMPEGMVVLPGLDQTLDKKAWHDVDTQHPQHGLKKLLREHFPDVERADIDEFPTAKEDKSTIPDDAFHLEARRDLLALALRPAEATGDWLSKLEERKAPWKEKNPFKNLHIATLRDEDSEATAIALIMRECLETPEKTTLLVTPNRDLVRRVSLKLTQWDILLDDSAGVPLANSLRGNFLRLVAQWLDDPSHPIRLLSLIRHPLACFGLPSAQKEDVLKQLDKALRGPRPGPGFEGLTQKIYWQDQWDALPQEAKTEHTPPLSPLLQDFIPALKELHASFFDADIGVMDKIHAHITIAEKICTTPLRAGKEILWAFEDGREAARLFEDMAENIAFLPREMNGDYSGVFEAISYGRSVRKQGVAHPRLAAMGPLEARLQSADCVILGGLNEGQWPDGHQNDPFLSDWMRKSIGLQTADQRIGLAAHDFSQFACAKEVFLTRAEKSARTPTKPSRWLVRLVNILKHSDMYQGANISSQLQDWCQSLYAVQYFTPASPPTPCPPVSNRPNKLSVTNIEKLLRDPFSIYAQKILQLRQLSPPDEPVGAAIRGRFFHHIFARFFKEHKVTCLENDMIRKHLHQYADDLFHRLAFDSTQKSLWQRDIAESFQWFCEFSQKQIQSTYPTLLEEKAVWNVSGITPSFQLVAKVDRVDIGSNGADIIDYKTGQLPTSKQLKTFSPQLLLTALMIEDGAFEKTGKVPVEQVRFIKILNRRTNDKESILSGDDLFKALPESLTQLQNLIRHYRKQNTPYLSQPRPAFQSTFGAYDHLARRKEWTGNVTDDS